MRVPEDGRRRERHITAVPTDTRHHASTRMLRAIAVHADAFDHAAAQIEAVDVRLRAVQVVLMHQVGGHRGKHDGARAAVDHGLPAPPVGQAAARTDGDPARRLLHPVAKHDVRYVASWIVGQHRFEGYIPAVVADARRAAVAGQRPAVYGGALECDRGRRAIEHVRYLTESRRRRR